MVAPILGRFTRRSLGRTGPFLRLKLYGRTYWGVGVTALNKDVNNAPGTSSQTASSYEERGSVMSAARATPRRSSAAVAVSRPTWDEDVDWQTQAACRGADANLFFAPTHQET